MKTRNTFKPQLETLEGRNAPSAAGVGLYLQLGPIQQEVQAMQAQASAANTTFAQLGADLNAGNMKAFSSDLAKLGGQIQTVRALDSQLNAQLQGFQQSIFMLASDGDQMDQGIALYSYLQINGGFGGLFGGSSDGGLAGQAKSALDRVNQIASSPNYPSPNQNTSVLFAGHTTTIDQMLT